MDVLVTASDADDFSALLVESGVQAQDSLPEIRHGFDGVDLAKFVLEISDNRELLAVALGYWLGQGRVIVIDDEGLHIKINKIKDIITTIFHD